MRFDYPISRSHRWRACKNIYERYRRIDAFGALHWACLAKRLPYSRAAPALLAGGARTCRTCSIVPKYSQHNNFQPQGSLPQQRRQLVTTKPGIQCTHSSSTGRPGHNTAPNISLGRHTIIETTGLHNPFLNNCTHGFWGNLISTGQFLQR